MASDAPAHTRYGVTVCIPSGTGFTAGFDGEGEIVEVFIGCFSTSQRTNRIDPDKVETKFEAIDGRLSDAT